MQVNVQYDKYNTVMIKADIPLEEDANISLEVVENEVDDTTVQNLVLKGVDTLTNTEIKLSMTKVEIREFMSLLNKFYSSMD